MSCSNIINTFTYAKYLFPGVTRYRLTFTCGKCSGCISKQRTDWRVRAYYESLDCLSKPGSFVLFDTLTYTDSNVRHYSDIFPDMRIPHLLNGYAFSRPDVQKFFKRLRINLSRAGYRFDSSQLRYILTSEYGTDEKRTHRPHYHLLFFVTFPIHPIEFSRHVSRAWTFGKTDGVRPYEDCKKCPVHAYCKGTCIYQLESYVINERLVTSNSLQNCMKCVNYVTKYISKDMCNSGDLQVSVDRLWNYMAPEYKTDYLVYKKYRKFCSQVLPFHLQSLGFGRSLIGDKKKGINPIDGDEYKYLIGTNKVHLPTGKKDVIRSVALPRYYLRKLYYDYFKEDGRVRWYLTSDGIINKVAHLDDAIATFAREYREFDKCISPDRLRDLALYKVVYRGTFSDVQSLMLPYHDYYSRMLRFHHQDETPLYFNFNTKRDSLTIGKFLSIRYVVSSDGEILFKGKQLHEHFIPFDGYLLVDDKVCPFWNGFDRKLASYDRWRKGIAINRDSIAYVDECNVEYYKSHGMLPVR